jgi:5-methylcytosine-specific restriction protein A
MSRQHSDYLQWKYLYDLKEWTALRKHQLNTSPLCHYCTTAGKITPATVVDHIVPHKGNKDLFRDPDNLQSLCKLCHDSAKAKEEIEGAPIGCDASGVPNDPQHHWNVGRGRGG